MIRPKLGRIGTMTYQEESTLEIAGRGSITVTEVTHLSRPLASCAQSSGFFLKRLNLGFIRELWVADLSV